MATILDETAILRYLLNDNAREARQVADVIASGDAYVHPEMITRAAVVLRDVYHVPRTMVARVLEWMLDEVNASERAEIMHAIRLFGNTPMDFTDCMLVARNVISGHKVLSFDKAIVKRALP